MQSSPLADDDVRAMVKLLGDIAGMNGTLETKRRSLVEGLARLIDADAWYWAILGNSNPGESPTFSVFCSGLVYKPKKNSSLDPVGWIDLTATPTFVPINTNWRRVIYEEAADPASQPKCFGMLEVTLP